MKDMVVIGHETKNPPVGISDSIHLGACSTSLLLFTVVPPVLDVFDNKTGSDTYNERYDNVGHDFSPPSVSKLVADRSIITQ